MNKSIEYFYNKYRNKIYGVAYNKFKYGVNDIEDCVLDIVYRIYTKQECITESEGGYVNSIINNYFYDKYRRMDKVKFISLSGSGYLNYRNRFNTFPIVEEDLSIDYTDYNKYSEIEELKDKLHSVLKGLPKHMIKPITMYFLEDKSIKEISDVLGIPENTVKTRIFRAKKIIKLALRGYYE